MTLNDTKVDGVPLGEKQKKNLACQPNRPDGLRVSRWEMQFRDGSERLEVSWTT